MKTRRPFTVLFVIAVVALVTAAFTFRSRLQQGEHGRTRPPPGCVPRPNFPASTLPWPRVLSDYRLVQSSEPFGRAPINSALYGDPLCSRLPGAFRSR